MVASDSIYASQAGLEILRAGGNAFDAAAAVSFALAVVRPQSTGLGGGGFMLARLGSDGSFTVLDFRETAPAAATADMFERAVRQDPDAPPPSLYGHSAVCVPGVLAGRVRMLESFGTRSLPEVLAPAIRLAREGFAVDDHYCDACQTVLGYYRQYPQLTKSCEYVYRVHLRNGDLPRPGDRLVQPELACLLETIAARGPDVFYRGPVASALEREMQAGGGILRASDLAEYQVVENRRPIVSTYRDYTIVSMPPPSSGGICLVEALNILERFDLPATWRRDPAAANHLVIEAMKHAFADRARWLGDSDFVSVPAGLLTSKVYASQLAAAIDGGKCQEIDTYGADVIPDDAGTSHFCIVDRWGNAVVSTETINTSFGSLAAVGQWGLILNNEMDDFSARPGRVNAYGLTQSQRNAVASGKRPLSSMSPTIVLDGREPYVLLGGSGGPRIISSVLNVLLGVTDFGLSLEEAMLRPRVHHQWRPDEVFFDGDPPPRLAAALRTRGQRISDQRRSGIVQGILIDQGQLIGAADPRKGGAPAGY
jgi:gamma-glutamyltranspeptidase/glutathione hydrolase